MMACKAMRTGKYYMIICYVTMFLMAPSLKAWAVDESLATTLSNDLMAVSEMDSSHAIEQMSRYRVHADNRSRLDRRSRTEEMKSFHMSRKAQRILSYNLDPSLDGRRDSEFAVDVMGSMTSGRALAVIAALEDEKNFNAAALLASKFVDRQLEQDQQDLFCLIAARNIWLSRNKQLRNRYQELIDRARQSKNGQIAGDARLWVMAVKAPGSYDSICLSQQIWETLFYDIGDRNRSYQMSHLIGSVGPQVIEQIIDNEPDDEFKQVEVAQVASYISEAGYQLQEGDWNLYAENIVSGMVYPDAEDLAAISYYHGMYFLSIDSYGRAAGYFERVFVSDVTPDIEFEAGYRLAACYYKKHDYISTKATINVLQEWYPDSSRIGIIKKFEKHLQPYIKDKAQRVISQKVEEITSRKLANTKRKAPFESARSLDSNDNG